MRETEDNSEWLHPVDGSDCQPTGWTYRLTARARYQLRHSGIKLEMTKTIFETRSIYCAHQPLVSIQESKQHRPGRDHKNGMTTNGCSATVITPLSTSVKRCMFLPRENVTLGGDRTRDQWFTRPTYYDHLFGVGLT